MQDYAKIDRATGAVMKRKRMDGPRRALHKIHVWLPVERPRPPAFDAETHKLVPDLIQPDLSDLAVAVPEDAVRIETHNVVALTAAEILALTNAKIAASDAGLVRGLEDLIVMISEGTPLNRDNIPARLLDKVNARRALRGLDPV